jgi:branched-chain amino acid transport system ATP-binding protein
MEVLRLNDLHLSFGGVTALAGVSLDVHAGDFFAIIGPNGAGKTSVFNCISGIYAPTKGHILFDGHDITSLKPHQRAKRGIARTFQNIALFKGMTVLDNIKIGRHGRLSRSSSSRTFVTRSSAPSPMGCRNGWSWPGR